MVCGMVLEGFASVGDALRSGVYALCAKGVVIYVGKSRSMIARINAHRRAWIDKKKGQAWLTESLGIPGLQFDEIHIRPCPLHQLDALEREMIDKYKPRYNTQLVTSGKIKAPIQITVGGVTVAMNVQRQSAVVVERRC
jgi:excinuclease UvrABC nuclease subunit